MKQIQYPRGLVELIRIYIQWKNEIDLEGWIKFIDRWYLVDSISSEENSTDINICNSTGEKFRDVDLTQMGKTLKSQPREVYNSGKL